VVLSGLKIVLQVAAAAVGFAFSKIARRDAAHELLLDIS